jgi:hypothetical protein
LRNNATPTKNLEETMSIDRRAFLQSTADLATLSAAGCATVEKAPQQMAKASASHIITSALKSNADAILSASATAGGVYLSQVLPFADVKSLPLYYVFEKSVYQAMA